MKALSAKPLARVGGNGFWDPLRLEAYKSQWALIPNPGPLHESPLGINHNSFKIAGKATGPEKKYFTSCDPHHDIYRFSYWQIFWHSICVAFYLAYLLAFSCGILSGILLA